MLPASTHCGTSGSTPNYCVVLPILFVFPAADQLDPTNPRYDSAVQLARLDGEAAAVSDGRLAADKS